MRSGKSDDGTSIREGYIDRLRGLDEAGDRYWPMNFLIRSLNDLDYTARLKSRPILKSQSQHAEVYMAYLDDDTCIAIKRVRFSVQGNLREIAKVSFWTII